MNKLIFSSAIVALCFSTASIRAQDQAQDAAAAQAEFLDALKLAPEHAHLKSHVGKWTTEMKTYFEGPDSAAVSKGSATFTLLYDGRYLQQVFKGEFAGVPFQGRGLTGFDKTKKKFVSTWIDNFETGILTMEGTYDEKTKTMTEVGISHSAEGETKMKNVTKQIDKDTVLFSMYMTPPGGTEALGMEITYRRVK